MRPPMKKCPFCGNSKVRIVDYPIGASVECSECETIGPAGDSKQDARDKWNNRPHNQGLITDQAPDSGLSHCNTCHEPILNGALSLSANPYFSTASRPLHQSSL